MKTEQQEYFERVAAESATCKDLVLRLAKDSLSSTKAAAHIEVATKQAARAGYRQNLLGLAEYMRHTHQLTTTQVNSGPECKCDSKALVSSGHETGCKYAEWKARGSIAAGSLTGSNRTGGLRSETWRLT